MGKDKPPKGGASKVQEKQQEPVAPEPPKKPAAKGHRQRGAGTVITAKAAVTTNDGVVLKPHERLPYQVSFHRSMHLLFTFSNDISPV